MSDTISANLSFFEYVDRDKISSSLLCGICFEPFIKPLIHTLGNCGVSYCESCLKRLKRKQCPSCRCDFIELNEFNLYCINRSISNTVDELRMKCNACDKECLRSELQFHLNCCTSSPNVNGNCKIHTRMTRQNQKLNHTNQNCVKHTKRKRVAKDIININPYYMIELQTDLSPMMRTILVSWLHMLDMVLYEDRQVDLSSDSFYLTIYFLDCFLSTQVVSRGKLQLLGIVALFLAAKIKDKIDIGAEFLVSMTANSYTVQQFDSMSKQIIKALSITETDDVQFISCWTKAQQYIHALEKKQNQRFDRQTVNLIQFILQSTLQDYSFSMNQVLLKNREQLAISAVYLGISSTDNQSTEFNWYKSIFSHYTYVNIQPLIDQLLVRITNNKHIENCNSPDNDNGVVLKFESGKYGKFSFVPLKEKPINVVR